MRKKNKIDAVKELLTDSDKPELTDAEIKFLKTRNIDLQHKAPLMIYSGDNESKAKIIKAIALKLNCPVIRIVKAKVINKAPGIVTAAKQKEGMYDDIIEVTGMDKGTLKNIISVTKAIESSRRNDDLSYSHHIEVASLTPEKQTEFLNKAVEETIVEKLNKGKVKLSFPSVWDGMDDDDDMNFKIKEQSVLRPF